MTSLSISTVKHVASLANLPLTEAEEKLFAKQLTSILDLVSQLQKADTKDVVPTSQVTGLTNVMREDEIDATRTFTQEQALSNAQKTHNGFFVVPAIFE
jgi:aspartyl-tRNA(Asn)/glutamyl-tRNA(Gln) amidotransferase subunit C